MINKARLGVAYQILLSIVASVVVIVIVIPGGSLPGGAPAPDAGCPRDRHTLAQT